MAALGGCAAGQTNPPTQRAEDGHGRNPVAQPRLSEVERERRLEWMADADAEMEAEA